MSISHRPQSDEPLSGHAFQLLFNMVYCSRATPGIDDAAWRKSLKLRGAGTLRKASPACACCNSSLIQGN